MCHALNHKVRRAAMAEEMDLEANTIESNVASDVKDTAISTWLAKARWSSSGISWIRFLIQKIAALDTIDTDAAALMDRMAASWAFLSVKSAFLFTGSLMEPWPSSANAPSVRLPQGHLWLAPERTYLHMRKLYKGA